MNIAELYAKTPIDKHQQIVISGGRLFFDGDEYMTVSENDELRLVHSLKGLENDITSIKATVDEINKKLGK